MSESDFSHFYSVREPEPEPEWIQNTKKGNKKEIGMENLEKCFAPHKILRKMFRTP